MSDECTCHCGHPPCGYCTDGPGSDPDGERDDDAVEKLDRIDGKGPQAVREICNQHGRVSRLADIPAYRAGVAVCCEGDYREDWE